MKSSAFEYARPDTLAAALDLLRQHEGNAQILAGGQTLLALMNLRLAAPALLIDISRLPGLGGIQQQGDVLRIGALVTHRQLQQSSLVTQQVPLLAAAVPHVAHMAIRNRGTIGGSLALADPAAEYPAVALALNATLVAVGTGGERRIAAQDFFLGLYQTALQGDELLAAVEFPVARAGQRFAFHELARRHGDYALAGVALALQLSGARIESARLACLAVADRPVLATRAMAALTGNTLETAVIEQAQQALADDLSPTPDLQGASATKLHWQRTLLGRALHELVQ